MGSSIYSARKFYICHQFLNEPLSPLMYICRLWHHSYFFCANRLALHLLSSRLKFLGQLEEVISQIRNEFWRQLKGNYYSPDLLFHNMSWKIGNKDSVPFPFFAVYWINWLQKSLTYSKVNWLTQELHPLIFWRFLLLCLVYLFLCFDKLSNNVLM